MLLSIIGISVRKINSVSNFDFLSFSTFALIRRYLKIQHFNINAIVIPNYPTTSKLDLRYVKKLTKCKGYRLGRPTSDCKVGASHR